MIRVVLTEYEMAMCAQVGRMRHASARARGRDPGRGPTSRGDVQGDIRGAQCEFACHIGLNLFWRPDTWGGDHKDVGELAQVRSTDLPNGRMIVKPDDDDADPFVLVRQQGRVHDLLGWLDARAAKASAPLTEDHGDPAHFVGQGKLRDIHTLKRRLHHGIVLDEIELEHATQQGRRRA